RPHADSTRVGFDDLLAQSDFVSLHCPLTDDTRDLIDAQAFAKMKKSAFLINCARGGIVNEAALADALKQGEIAGAATDVL
ncbi:glycerate dehydrogenase, partial [bacterium LRH843]|nr:glycerate dehydrogenase [bacterium LRH843]